MLISVSDAVFIPIRMIFAISFEAYSFPKQNVSMSLFWAMMLIVLVVESDFRKNSTLWMHVLQFLRSFKYLLLGSLLRVKLD